MRARDNPFSTDRVLQLRYRPQGGTWEDILRRLAAAGHRGAIVGPQGSGKTTLLEDLAPALRSRGFRVRTLRLDREQPRFPCGALDALFADIGGRDVILFDGAEQLGRPGWWRFRRRARRAGGLIITTHRRGMLPTLVECGTTPALLGELVRELLGGASEERGDFIAELYVRHRGNLRDALREMYDVYAEREYGSGLSVVAGGFTGTFGGEAG